MTITYTRLKHVLCFIIGLISVQDDGTVKVLLIHEGPRGSLANNVPSCAIEQANQEV